LGVSERKLQEFHGGLHLQGHKALSTGRPLLTAPVPRLLIFPLQQHIGEPANPVVEVGERVRKGQSIARATGYVSAAVHASSSGTVVAIEERPVPHPSGLSAPCIVIETDGRDEWIEARESARVEDLEPAELRARVRASGIVGLGGAAFPTSVKLNPGEHRPVEILVLNGAECEPYITCDDMLMRERTREIIAGIRILRHALQPKETIIGIEENKPEAIAALREALQQEEAQDIELVDIPTIYPTGGEKQLVKVLTGREIPSNGLSFDVGVVCQNVGTAAALHRAIDLGEPLISRFVTVTGGAVHQPRNVEVRLGTPVRDLIDFCGGYTDDVDRLLQGGPMMGFALHTDMVPIIKATNCILVAAHGEVFQPDQPMPCIRCGACESACPARLLPQQLYWYARSRDLDKAQEYHLFDCIECGCCAAVCPSHIPLVQYYRYAKTEVWDQERNRRAAELARRRHEFREARLERLKREHEEARRKKREALKHKPETAETDPKKAAIESALARVKAKTAAAESESAATKDGN
jgi:electron transport complex protein RnfC